MVTGSYDGQIFQWRGGAPRRMAFPSLRTNTHLHLLLHPCLRRLSCALTAAHTTTTHTGIGCTGRAAPATAHKAAVVALSASGAEVVTAGTDDSAHWAALPLPECGSPAVHKLPGAPLGLSASANGTALCLTNKARGGTTEQILLCLVVFLLSADGAA